MSNAKSFTVKFVAALTARNAEQPSRDTDNAISILTTGEKAIELAMSRPEFAEVAKNLIKGARYARASDDKGAFIAVKVLVKIAHALEAIGNGMSSTLDPYSRVITENLLSLNGISNKSALVSLSKSIEYDALDQEQALKTRYNCSVGTASTQASSSRMMLKYLDICAVSKGKRADVITLLDNDRARTYAALFVKS